MEAEVILNLTFNKYNYEYISRFAHASHDDVPLDVVQVHLARFCQTIALLKSQYTKSCIQSGVLPFIAQILREHQNDLIIGCAAITLTHLSLYTNQKSLNNSQDSQQFFNAKIIIVKANLLSPLLHICVWNTNPNVLCEIIKLIASLAKNLSNKRAIASKQGVKILVDFLKIRIDENHVQQSAITVPVLVMIFTALVNLTHGKKEIPVWYIIKLILFRIGSEIIQTQIVSLGGLPLIIEILNTISDMTTCTQGARLLANLAHKHFLNQGTIITYEGNVALVNQLKREDACGELKEACFWCFCNLAHHGNSQDAIGYSDAVPLIVHSLVQDTCPRILAAASAACASLCYSNMVNKHRFAQEHGAEALLLILSSPERYNNDNDVLSFACRALSSYLQADGSVRFITQLEGVFSLVQLCANAVDSQVIRCSGMVVASLSPTEGERYDLESEGRPVLVTQYGGISVLERVRHSGYTQEGIPVPFWLEETLRVLSASSQELHQRPESDWLGVVGNVSESRLTVRAEFYERGVLAHQFFTCIVPDETCSDFFCETETVVETLSE